MASVRRRLARVEVTLDRRERALLSAMVDDLAPEVGTARRTVLRAYEDEELEREYARWTRPEVDAARRADIEGMRRWLAGGDDRVRLDDDAALGWVRALEHLRLVAGARLGIEKDGWEESAPEELLESHDYAVLVTLGWLQEALLEALGDP